MTTEESPENRAAYIEALKTERTNLLGRIDSASRKRRLADVEAELDQYGETPSKRTRQTAAKKAAPAKGVAATDPPSPVGADGIPVLGGKAAGV